MSIWSYVESCSRVTLCVKAQLPRGGGVASCEPVRRGRSPFSAAPTCSGGQSRVVRGAPFRSLTPSSRGDAAFFRSRREARLAVAVSCCRRREHISAGAAFARSPHDPISSHAVSDSVFAEGFPGEAAFFRNAEGCDPDACSSGPHRCSYFPVCCGFFRQCRVRDPEDCGSASH